MRKMRTLAGAALLVVTTVGLSACGGSGESNSNASSKAEGKYNAGTNSVVNPSDKKGGIIKMLNAGEWDTYDPGETYYAFSWDFSRLYGRSLLTYKSAPGQEGVTLAPDLAESLGQPSNDAKTWTYTLRQGVKFEDGTEVKAADVKHAVLRSVDKETFPNGPAYFEALLNFPEGYKGPYKTPDINTDSAISTPDDYTIVFNLKKPMASFDYLMQMPQTMPVPAAKDTGAKYKEHVLSTGPYKFDKNEPGKMFTLVRNDQWDEKTDPNRKALPDGFEVSLNVNADDIDNRIISGDAHIDVTGTGVQPSALARVLTDPTLKSRADNPVSPRLWYTSIIGTVAPLDNVECRRAIEFAMDRTAYQKAVGGDIAGGDLATTVLPPSIPGYEKYDQYPAGSDSTGDLDKAKEALAQCGQPEGFTTKMAYRAERPKEKAIAEAFQQSLSRVGITVELQGYPQGKYFSEFAGNPGFVTANGIGLATNGWHADWSDGFGFLSQIVDSRVIRPNGGAANLSVRSPEIDALLDNAAVELDTTTRNAIWGQIDKKVMDEAYIYPGVYAKSLLVRGKGLTNVYVHDGFGMYDYSSLGLE